MSEVPAQELRLFGVRMAVVIPGIVDTRMARNIESLAPSTVYPIVRRLETLFAGVMAGPCAQPEMVAGKVR